MIHISRPRRGISRFLDVWASNAIDHAAKWMPSPLISFAAHVLFWPTLTWNYFVVHLNSELNWHDEILYEENKGRLILGGYPWPRSMVEKIENENVSLVLNTVGEKQDYMFRENIKIRNFQMRDFEEPMAKEVLAAVHELDAALQDGETVYIHCKAGKGRSATVVLCWLVMKRGMSLEEAQSLLSTRRPQVLSSLWKRSVVSELLDR